MEKSERTPLSAKEVKTLETLKKVLEKYGLPASYYSFNGYSEEAVCLEKMDWFWICFNAERGNKFNVVRVSNLEDACVHLIQRVVDSFADECYLIKEFKTQLHNV